MTPPPDFGAEADHATGLLLDLPNSRLLCGLTRLDVSAYGEPEAEPGVAETPLNNRTRS